MDRSGRRPPMPSNPVCPGDRSPPAVEGRGAEPGRRGPAEWTWNNVATPCDITHASEIRHTGSGSMASASAFVASTRAGSPRARAPRRRSLIRLDARRMSGVDSPDRPRYCRSRSSRSAPGSGAIANATANCRLLKSRVRRRETVSPPPPETGPRFLLTALRKRYAALSRRSRATAGPGRSPLFRCGTPTARAAGPAGARARPPVDRKLLATRLRRAELVSTVTAGRDAGYRPSSRTGGRYRISGAGGCHETGTPRSVAPGVG
ncbi:hypothetical protein Ae707Ps1_6066 [Pseudonocardia sp. Ae707_Ps1]|nr:hypothetical protein Ae707Ps1_6066 [Pseudonocardia sp. Ae707_Ps1]